MIPLWDDNSQERTKPIVNYTLIALNVLFFLLELAQPDQRMMFSELAAIPASVYHGYRQWTLVTSMFLHAGWMHLLGNMLFLWVFGDNVEDRFGHLRYLVFYLTAGIAAGFAQIIMSPYSMVPLVGASGAIAGVLAAYLIMFPKNNVEVLFLARLLLEVPAYVAIGGWLLTQFVMMYLVSGHSGGGGVAYDAHIGGFLAGSALTLWLRNNPAQIGALSRPAKAPSAPALNPGAVPPPLPAASVPPPLPVTAIATVAEIPSPAQVDGISPRPNG